MGWNFKIICIVAIVADIYFQILAKKTTKEKRENK
jgi:hypothetical protein